MNVWLSLRSEARMAQAVRAVVRRGTQVGQHLFAFVGGTAVVLALALWLMPSWRGTFAARLMPFISAAVQAGPVRLLQGNPLPSFSAPQSGSLDDTLSSASTAPSSPVSDAGDAKVSLVSSRTSYDSAFDTPNANSMGVAALNGLDPRTMQSVGALARLIPSQRVSADARDDRILVSSREQDLVANYIARRYHVAQDPVSQLVKAAFDTGREVGLDPLLLLSVMAIESGFNPYAESGVGAQGLMQVMSKVHSDKFSYFGGESAALQPLANIKVGALVLKDCIARGGSLPGGLRLYVGSTSPDDGGYGAKVMAERGRLRDVARGRKVPINAPQSPVAPVTTASNNSTKTTDSNKRVHVTIEASAPAPQQQAKLPVSQDDNSNNGGAATKHVQQPEMGV